MIYTIANTEAGLLQANALRNANIAQKKGALLVREDCDGGNKELLEKILVAVEFDAQTPVASQPWKPDSIVILVGAAASKLDDFEAMCPGFTEFFGPVTAL
jgi:hypothetical protein